MTLGPQIIATFDNNNDVGSTEAYWGLVPNNTNTLPHLLVVGFDLYTIDPSAVFRATVLRVEGYSNASPVTGTNSPRASATTRDRHPAIFTDPSGVQSISNHSFCANAPLEFRFPEPLEVRKDWDNTADHYFALAIKRMDNSSSVRVLCNVYYNEY